MAEHDPQAFDDLFRSEPDAPRPGEVAEWTDLYTRLVELLERQLRETEQFTASAPEAFREYLSRENLKILTEELEVFRARLARWRSMEQ